MYIIRNGCDLLENVYWAPGDKMSGCSPPYRAKSTSIIAASRGVHQCGGKSRVTSVAPVLRVSYCSLWSQPLVVEIPSGSFQFHAYLQFSDQGSWFHDQGWWLPAFQGRGVQIIREQYFFCCRADEWVKHSKQIQFWITGNWIYQLDQSWSMDQIQKFIVIYQE